MEVRCISLCAGVQRFVREDRVGSNSVPVDIFRGMTSAYFKSALDSALKELHAKGIGTSKNELKSFQKCLKTDYGRRVY